MSVPKLDFMWQYVEHWAKVDPGFIALRSDDRRITSGEFDSLSDSLARSFLRMGLGKGGTIVTMLPSSIEFILTLIAADKVGAIVTAMDMKYKAADLRRFISHIKPAIIVAHPRSGDTDIAASLASVCDELKMRGRVTFVMVGGGPGENFDALTREGPGFEDELRRAKASCGLDDGLLIVFTGGTTGVPKAALLTKQNVAAMASIEAEYLSNIVPGRIKSLASLPPSHVGGTVEMMGAPIAGGHELLIHDTWSPQRVLKTTQEEKLSWIGGVPTMFAIMLLTPDLGAYDLSSLKLAIMSGEKVDMDLLGLITGPDMPHHRHRLREHRGRFRGDLHRGGRQSGKARRRLRGEGASRGGDEDRGRQREAASARRDRGGAGARAAHHKELFQHA